MHAGKLWRIKGLRAAANETCVLCSMMLMADLPLTAQGKGAVCVDASGKGLHAGSHLCCAHQKLLSAPYVGFAACLYLSMQDVMKTLSTKLALQTARCYSSGSINCQRPNVRLVTAFVDGLTAGRAFKRKIDADVLRLTLARAGRGAMTNTV